LYSGNHHELHSYVSLSLFFLTVKMSRGGSAGGGQSSLGYLFGDGEPAKPAAAAAAKAPPAEKPAPAAVDVTKQIPAGIPGSRANNYHRSEGQNTGNFLTVCLFSLVMSMN
jgi:SPIRAL1-like protein